MIDGRADRHADVQRETIIPCHYRVAGYEKDNSFQLQSGPVFFFFFFFFFFNLWVYDPIILNPLENKLHFCILFLSYVLTPRIGCRSIAFYMHFCLKIISFTKAFS